MWSSIFVNILYKLRKNLEIPFVSLLCILIHQFLVVHQLTAVNTTTSTTTSITITFDTTMSISTIITHTPPSPWPLPSYHYLHDHYLHTTISMSTNFKPSSSWPLPSKHHLLDHSLHTIISNNYLHTTISMTTTPTPPFLWLQPPHHHLDDRYLHITSITIAFTPPPYLPSLSLLPTPLPPPLPSLFPSHCHFHPHHNFFYHPKHLHLLSIAASTSLVLTAKPVLALCHLSCDGCQNTGCLGGAD